ncbi:MAG: hypothetical protein AB7S26_07365 [Sandaracinaceae bacterium]
MSVETKRLRIAIAGVTVALLGWLAYASWTASPSEPSAPREAPPCPERYLDLPVRAERIETLLGSTAVGTGLLAALEDRPVRYCFGEIERPSIQGSQLLLLDASADDAELAARVGHLLDHAVHGLPFPETLPPNPDCDAMLAEAMAREARGYAVEVELRERLQLEPSRYDFEPAARAASTEARVAMIERYLLDHPEGGRNLDSLGVAYRQRCEIAARSAR